MREPSGTAISRSSMIAHISRLRRAPMREEFKIVVLFVMGGTQRE
jgi:hypothetical protein